MFGGSGVLDVNSKQVSHGTNVISDRRCTSNSEFFTPAGATSEEFLCAHTSTSTPTTVQCNNKSALISLTTTIIRDGFK